MIDLLDKCHPPTLNEIGEFIQNPVFSQFCKEIKDQYQCTEKIEFSPCSWEMGWNIKFKKAGKTLCTIYPRELYFTVMVVIGQREKEQVKDILPECASTIRKKYHQTKEGNGQKWLMIDIEDKDETYQDLLRLIQIRKNC